MRAPQLVEADLQLQAGEGRAHAEVDAATEPDVGGIAPAGVEAVGLVELLRVAVRGAEEHRHLVTHRQRLPGDLHTVVEHPALEQLQG